MKAYVIENFGSTDVFREMEMECPPVGANQVLIEVKASSVNPLDYKIRQGAVPYFTHAFPAILHADVAGVVRKKGGNVLGLEIGDEVFACAGGVRGRQGALADFMAADAELVARKPRSLGFAESAALPLVSITAWEALVESGALEPGKKILIFGATGGVGHIALQLAKAHGAETFAWVGSPEKADLARSLGADHAILYRQESLDSAVKRLTGGRGFDVVLDTVGGETFIQAMGATRLRGTVVTIAARTSFDMSVAFGKALRVQFVNMTLPMATGIGMARHGGILREIARMVDAGQLRPHLAPQRFSFAKVAEAHAYAEKGEAGGKVVLTRS